MSDAIIAIWQYSKVEENYYYYELLKITDTYILFTSVSNLHKTLAKPNPSTALA